MGKECATTIEEIEIAPKMDRAAAAALKERWLELWNFSEEDIIERVAAEVLRAGLEARPR